MRDQKYLRKNMQKISSLYVKDFANKIKKPQAQTKSPSSIFMNPELKLEN
jgi:hypothetical protein